LHSKTPGHLKILSLTAGVEITTGPLGKALRMVSVGIAEAHLARSSQQEGISGRR
jgi:transketolase